MKKLALTKGKGSSLATSLSKAKRCLLGEHLLPFALISHSTEEVLTNNRGFWVPEGVLGQEVLLFWLMDRKIPSWMSLGGALTGTLSPWLVLHFP